MARSLCCRALVAGRFRTRMVSGSHRTLFDLSNKAQSGEHNEGSTPLRILARCEELHTQIQPLNDRLRGPLERHSHKTTALPFVLLLGNHSSGKSSFINYVLGRNVQTSGVAPTDDSFTIVAPGKTDVDQDGPALVGDPDMGFSGLRQFGPPLVHHMQLKIRSDTSAPNFMMVDSPGMIDSPLARRSDFDKSSVSPYVFDRGYDFEGTVKWFAERADVILLFFDPDKPGTTGETLGIMTNSLVGMDHKLHIVLNKADQFRKIHDFARAYGSLCWNLSKVIPRKDLPRIHTMCLPQPKAAGESAESSNSADPYEISRLGSGLADLHATRDHVVEEVRKAPKRRIDNNITRLMDAVHLLQMHATVTELVRKEWRAEQWRGRLRTSAALLATAVSAGGLHFLGMPLEAMATMGGAGLISSGGVYWYGEQVLHSEERRLLSADGLNTVFELHYSSSIAEGDAFVASVWQRVRDRLQFTLKAQGLGNVTAVSAQELESLQKLLDVEIPNLRRLAAPLDYSNMVRDGYSSRSTDDELEK